MRNVITIPFSSETELLAIIKALRETTGMKVRARGRHSNRKAVLGSKWRKNSQNDIPWRQAERVSLYLFNK